MVIDKEKWIFLYQTTFFEIDEDFDPQELNETKLINLSGLWWIDPNNAIDYPQKAYQEQDLFRERSIEEILKGTGDWQPNNCYKKNFICVNNQLIIFDKDTFDQYFEICESNDEEPLNSNYSVVSCVIKDSISIEELVRNKYVRYGTFSIKKLVITGTNEGLSCQESD